MLEYFLNLDAGVFSRPEGWRLLTSLRFLERLLALATNGTEDIMTPPFLSIDNAGVFFGSGRSGGHILDFSA